MSEPRAVETRPSRRGRLLLLAATLGAPLTWVGHLFGSYAYVPAACAGLPMWGLYLMTVAALGGLALTAFLAYLLWSGRLHPAGTYPVSSRQVGALGLLLVLFFTALILLEATPNLVTGPCEGLGTTVD